MARPAAAIVNSRSTQLAFEPIEVGALALDGPALPGEERREVEVDGAALDAQSRESARVLRGEAETPER